jgi:hypothetical protein
LQNEWGFSPCSLPFATVALPSDFFRSLFSPCPLSVANRRKKLALDQREAMEIFGVVANAFCPCENGKTKPPLALVKPLKVLDRHPDLLDEIKVA